MAHDNVLPLEGSSRLVAHDDYQIGEILVNEGKLTPADVERIVDLHYRSGMHFGEAARRLGLIDEATLQAALARQYGMPQLAPGDDGVSPELIAACQPHHPGTEELRSLRTQLLLRWLDPTNGRRVLAVVSPGRGEGRSFLAANLAVVFSQLGMRTLLIDADLRRPRQHRIFNQPDRVGLTTILAGRGDTNAVSPVSGCPKLSLLAAGAPPPNPQELLARPLLGELIEELSTKFELVIVDTSAAQETADAMNVIYRAGNALLLARKDHTHIGATGRLIHDVRESGARIVGTVINTF
jgi:chain length determinant protein tyrosine kinase EpsG